MTSLEYQAHCREVYIFCLCGAPATEFMHLKHVGMGGNRKKDHWEHFTGGMACSNCHALYDGRLGKKSGLEAILDKTGKNIVRVFMNRLMEWLPADQHLSLLKNTARWINNE